MIKHIHDIFEESIRVKKLFLETHADVMLNASRAMADAFRSGGKLLLFGNGGSATDASHIAAEFVNRFIIKRRGLPAIALATDMAVLTSIANDFGFNNIFSRQIEALGAPGDIAVAISTSGSSPNVLRGMEEARRIGMKVIVLTGEKGSRMAAMADFAFAVPSTDTPRIQECHNILGHVLCDLAERIYCSAD
ncbi:MAG: SIS domain-containing protein [Nitrospirae bacterium]|nr:SIS domain-containing protein [Nitrospirota bacterium]